MKTEKIIKPWEYGTLNVKGRYFFNDTTPFFWLGDTAWLIFANTNFEDAKKYLIDRSRKGFNVIQSCLVYAAEGMEDLNKMPVCRYDIRSEEYWSYCDKIIEYAEELGLYMALLPSWGSIVKNNILTEDNAEKYALYLINRYQERKNIIWILGGDIKASGYENLYNILGNTFKKNDSTRLIGFHPFGRCSSTQWFTDASWLDFNMFQSGHRRYDQAKLNAWDDTAEFFGEDNWKYVLRDYELSMKPTLDGEPSYEQILQGLHDPSQPYWQARDVCRYACWSVFAGAAGHTYGDNSVMQFYTGKTDGVTYGAKDDWHDALSHEGSFQMGYLKNLMTKFDFTKGKIRDDLLIGPQGEKYDRISIFASDEFLLVYNYSGRKFELDTSDYKGYYINIFMLSENIFSYFGKVTKNITVFDSACEKYISENKDVIFVISNQKIETKE